jgi:hypothetical protein
MKLNDRGAYGFTLELDELKVDQDKKEMIELCLKIFQSRITNKCVIREAFLKNLETRIILEFRMVALWWVLSKDEAGMGKKTCAKFLKRMDVIQSRYEEIQNLINGLSEDLLKETQRIQAKRTKKPEVVKE